MRPKIQINEQYNNPQFEQGSEQLWFELERFACESGDPLAILR
jgi:hypothetical protein